MADADGCSERSDGDSAGLGGMKMSLMDWGGNESQGLLTTYFETVMKIALADLKKGKMPTVKFLMDMANRFESGGSVAEAEYRSLADVLWREIEGQDGIGLAGAGAE